MNEAALVDRIYEAAILPDLWPDVLESLSEYSQAEGGVLYVVTPRRSTDGTMSLAPIPRWTSSHRARPYVEAFIRDGWLHGNVRAERAVRLAHSGFVTDQDLFTAKEIETDAFYNWARKQGVGWHSGLTIQAPSGDVVVFNFERRYIVGPMDASTVAGLDIFKADLARASLMSSRLNMERVQTTVSALSLLGLPAAVISNSSTIIAANEPFQRYMPSHFVEKAFGKFNLTDLRADRLLRVALTEVDNPDAINKGRSVKSIPIKVRGSDEALVLHAIPVRLSARDVFSGASMVLVVTPVGPREMPSASLVQGLFDLTAAEARVARLIGGGESVKQIAATTKVSAGTLRSQLKSIFLKTGVSRQAELVALLSSTVLPTAGGQLPLDGTR